MSSRPNILYIFTDQLRGDAVGYVADSQVLTPNINELAAHATVFTRCISNSPLCVPARASLTTGLLPRETGVWSNRKGADLNCPSHVRSIRDEGYTTAVIGKTHLWRTGPGPKPGMHARECAHLLEAWGFEQHVEVNDPIGTGSMGCAYTDHLQEIGFLDAHRRYIRNWIAEKRAGNPTPWAQEPSPVPNQEDIDSFIGGTAVNWLKDYSGDSPFYLQVQFTGPHDPYDGPQSHRDKYDVHDLDPGIGRIPDEPMSARVQSRFRKLNTVAKATEFQRQQWRVNYYANISLIDHWIGRLIEVLRQHAQLNNTWVLFTSDHGEMLGDHGLMGKTVFYEPSIHVPCLIRNPAGRHRECDDLVEHIDVPATLLEIADAPQNAASLGRSLVGNTLGKPPQKAKEVVFSELFGETTVVTHRYKLTVKADDLTPRLLLDRDVDPTEQRNFVNDKNYVHTMKRLVRDFLEPQRERLNHEHMRDYQNYVQRTGRLN